MMGILLTLTKLDWSGSNRSLLVVAVIPLFLAMLISDVPTDACLRD